MWLLFPLVATPIQLVALSLYGDSVGAMFAGTLLTSVGAICLGAIFDIFRFK